MARRKHVATRIPEPDEVEETSEEESQESEEEEGGEESEEEAMEEKRHEEKTPRVISSQAKKKSQKKTTTAPSAPDSPLSPNASDFTVKPISPVRRASRDAKPTSKRKSQEAMDDGKDLRSSKRAKSSGAHGKEGKISAVSAPGSTRVWSEVDEIILLEGMIDYKESKGVHPSNDMTAFYDFIKGKLNGNMSKTQLYEKVRRFKIKFFKHAGKDPVFSNAHESKVFELSNGVWGSEANTSADISGIGRVSEKKGTTKLGKIVKGVEKDSKIVKGVEKDGNIVKVGEKDAKIVKGGEKDTADMDNVMNDDGDFKSKDPDLSQSFGISGIGKESENKGAANKSDVMNDVGDFKSKYPNLSQSFDLNGLSFLREDLKSYLKENLSLINSVKAKELEEEWKKLSEQEAEFLCKKMSLIGEQTELVLNALE